MRVLIVAGGVLGDATVPHHVSAEDIKGFDEFIGVDRGCMWLLQHDMPLTAAIGDFDSVASAEFGQISLAAGELVALKPEKDSTDFEVALDYAVSHFPEADFVVLGALGGRLDHLMTNYRLPISGRFARFAQQITLIDSTNRVRYYTPGTYAVPRISGYRYIGFDQIGTDSGLSIEHARYPLKAGNVDRQTWASNEFIGDAMTISFSQGFVVAIYSNDADAAEEC